MTSNVELEEIRKSQIIGAALSTIARRGWANVTMDDICRTACLSKGGLLHYYKTKNDLFKAAFREFFKNIFQRGEEAMSSFEDPMDQILSFEWLCDSKDPDNKTGYNILYDFISIALHDHEYRRILRNWIKSCVNLVKKAILLGQSQGKFKNVDAESAARTISAVYQGIGIRWYLSREDHPDAWAKESVRRSIKGILAYNEETTVTQKRKEKQSKVGK